MNDEMNFKCQEARNVPVILMLDTSGSMSANGNIDVLNAAVKEMLDDFAKQSDNNVSIKVAIYTFGPDVKEYLPLSTADEAKAKFQPMDANGEELYKFESTVVGGAIPKEYIPAVGEGIEEAAQAGILGGFPVLGVHANVYDGSYHEVDSSEMAFHIAGSMAFKEAMQKASPVLLEPIMKVEVTMPEEYMGDVIGDINSRRGRIEGMDDIGGGKLVKAYVPLAEMFGYSTDLRSKTQGRGNYSMFFEKYEPVPKNVQEKVLADKSK